MIPSRESPSFHAAALIRRMTKRPGLRTSLSLHSLGSMTRIDLRPLTASVIDDKRLCAFASSVWRSACPRRARRQNLCLDDRQSACTILESPPHTLLSWNTCTRLGRLAPVLSLRKPFAIILVHCLTDLSIWSIGVRVLLDTSARRTTPWRLGLDSPSHPASA